MRVTCTKTISTILLTFGVLFMIACGASQTSEKMVRKSGRFYEAGSISWFQEHDSLAAIRNLTRAIDADPNNYEAHYLLGIIRFGRGENQEAEDHFKITAELLREADPAGLAGVQNNLGLLYIHQKKYTEAVVLLTASSKEVLNREPWLAMGNLGWAYIEMGEYDKAIETLRRALFDQSKYCVGLYRLGQAHYMKRDYETASKFLQQSVAIPEPGCDSIQEAHHLLGMCYLRQGSDAAAKKSLDRCQEINPETVTGLACSEALTGL